MDAPDVEDVAVVSGYVVGVVVVVAMIVPSVLTGNITGDCGKDLTVYGTT